MSLFVVDATDDGPIDISGASIVRARTYLSRLVEFDALFIRDTTGVNHYTYRVARRATAEGHEVIDDPESILRCNNKVFLAERWLAISFGGREHRSRIGTTSIESSRRSACVHQITRGSIHTERCPRIS